MCYHHLLVWLIIGIKSLKTMFSSMALSKTWLMGVNKQIQESWFMTRIVRLYILHWLGFGVFKTFSHYKCYYYCDYQYMECWYSIRVIFFSLSDRTMITSMLACLYIFQTAWQCVLFSLSLQIWRKKVCNPLQPLKPKLFISHKLIWTVQCNSFSDVHEEWLIRIGYEVVTVECEYAWVFSIWVFDMCSGMLLVCFAVVHMCTIYALGLQRAAVKQHINTKERRRAQLCLQVERTERFNAKFYYVKFWLSKIENLSSLQYVDLSLIFTASMLVHTSSPLYYHNCF